MFETPTASEDGFYKAYMTAELLDSPRTPIQGERIVIVLGEDDKGYPLELSICLKKPKFHPGKLTCCSLIEPTLGGNARSGFPTLVVEGGSSLTTAENVIQLSIRYMPR